MAAVRVGSGHLDRVPCLCQQDVAGQKRRRGRGSVSWTNVLRAWIEIVLVGAVFDLIFIAWLVARGYLR